MLDERDDRVIARFGGLWSREKDDYVGDARQWRVLRMHPVQAEFMEWFDEWLTGYRSGSPLHPTFDCGMTGGRRGGKSAALFTAAPAFALAVPGSITWVVCQSDTLFEEPMQFLESIMPRSWYRRLGAPFWTYYLANGSTIRLLSGHTPRKLKKGRCDFCVINEGQTIPNQSYVTVSASTVDSGGLVLSASNPPDVGDPGTWVSDLVAGIENGERTYARHFFFDPEMNPHADHVALRALAQKMDKHTYDVQVRGKFLQTPDSVLHAWDRSQNERPAGQLGRVKLRDITREFTRFHEGRPFDDIVGVDVQNFPWIAAVRIRVYENPVKPGHANAILWVVGEFYVDQGDEVECARQMLEAGCSHDKTLVITDASCEWQQQQRENKLQRDKYKGAGSMAMFRGEGYQRVVPPDDDMDANPRIVDRVRAANARIGTQSGDRQLFVDAKRAPRTAESVRKWRTSKTTHMPSRYSIHAHGGDALTYVVWRFFPRRDQKHEIDVQSIKRFGAGGAAKG